ncbi:ABC transporter substrate-binding protein [Microbacterium sp. YY-01]|uniref:ABC transporter substrate-binding protein n=1 Tax=Microbacterium sp. YY-01 TaxID=3421634 RepID=UPI003D162890
MSLSKNSRFRLAGVAAGATVLALALSACSGGSSAPSGGDGDDGISGTINIIGYSGIWEQRYTEAVIQPFQDAHPGVNVNYVAKRSSAEMLSALQSQGSRPGTDVAIMDQSVAQSGNEQGIFAKLDESITPNIASVKDEFLDPDGFGPVLHLDAIGILYDTEVFDSAPTSWEELWNPEWAGKVNLMAPPSLLGLAATAAASTIEGEDYTQSIDKGVAKLKELAPNVQTFAPNPDEWQSIITGQTVIGIGQNARGQYYADESNGKLGIAFPEEGTFYQLNTINLVEGAPNEEAAIAFVDYALSAEAQLAFAEALYYAPSVEVDIPAETADRIIATDGSIKILPFDVDFLAGVRDPWTDIWKREIISQ